MYEPRKLSFLLTGSSARKLKRGGLPAIYPSDDHIEELRAYTALYLKEEIQNEALTRKVAQFLEFLDLMALSNGEELNYQSISSDCGISPNSVKNYIQILEDTLVAFRLNAFTKTRRRKAISRSKLYFFDVGVTNTLANRGEILPDSELSRTASYLQAISHDVVQAAWRIDACFAWYEKATTQISLSWLEIVGAVSTPSWHGVAIFLPGHRFLILSSLPLLIS